MWKTKRLLLSPLSVPELEKRIADEENEEMKAAYDEMLEGVLTHPDEEFFYTDIAILRRDTKEHIGDACFKGAPVKGAVEIGYGILPAHQGQGYMSEALSALVLRAFCQKDVYSVEAETAPDNQASIRVLQYCGFQATGKVGEEGPRYAIRKSDESFIPTFMLFGLALGNAFSSLWDVRFLGTIGLAVGLLAGVIFNRLAKNHRKEICGE